MAWAELPSIEREPTMLTEGRISSRSLSEDSDDYGDSRSSSVTDMKTQMDTINRFLNDMI